MNDLQRRLDGVADEATPGDAGPHTDEDTVVGDLRRGRKALRRQRLRLATGPVLGAVAIAAVGYGVAVDRPGPVELPVAGGEQPGVQLVTYAQEVSGYEVAAVPEGWDVETATPWFLVIAPVGGVDEDVTEGQTSFVGKLVVMLRSVDESGTPAGDVIAVGDGTGYLDRANAAPFAAVLKYTDAADNEVVVQFPPALGWKEAEMAAFADGVVVTSAATPGHG